MNEQINTKTNEQGTESEVEASDRTDVEFRLASLGLAANIGVVIILLMCGMTYWLSSRTMPPQACQFADTTGVKIAFVLFCLVPFGHIACSLLSKPKRLKIRYALNAFQFLMSLLYIPVLSAHLLLCEGL